MVVKPVGSVCVVSFAVVCKWAYEPLTFSVVLVAFVSFCNCGSASVFGFCMWADCDL